MHLADTSTKVAYAPFQVPPILSTIRLSAINLLLSMTSTLFHILFGPVDTLYEVIRLQRWVDNWFCMYFWMLQYVTFSAYSELPMVSNNFTSKWLLAHFNFQWGFYSSSESQISISFLCQVVHSMKLDL